MPDIAKLQVVVDADTSAAERGLDSFGGKLGGIGGSLATVFGGAAIAGIAGVAAGITSAVSSAADFEKTMSGVKAVSGASAEEMGQLSGLALQLGKDTSFSASEAAKGLEELVKGGLSIPDIMNGAAKATLDLAAAGGVSLPDAATIAANALAEFNLKGEDMAHVADLIAGAANASALDVSDFKFSLSAAGAVAATVGFSFDDLAQGIAVMGKAGITGSDAGTSLKTMMMNLVPATNKAADTMRELGIITGDTGPVLAKLREGLSQTAAGQAKLADLTKSGLVGSEEELFKALDKVNPALTMGASSATDYGVKVGLLGNQFFDANGKVKSMAEVAGVLQTALAGMSEETRLATLRTLFGSDAIRAAAVIAKEGTQGFNDMAEAMGKVTAAEVGTERLNNLAGAWEQLKGSVETAAIEFGTALLPALTQVTLGLTSMVNDGIPILEALGAGLKNIITFFTAADAETVVAAFQKVRDGLNEALGPEAGAAVTQVMLDISETIQNVSDTIAQIMDEHGTQINAAWTKNWQGMVTQIAVTTQQILSVIRLFADVSVGDWEGAWSEITRISEAEHQKQVASAQRMADQTTAILDRYTGGWASTIRGFLDNIDEYVVGGWQAVVEATQAAGVATRQAVDETWAAVSETVSTAAHSIIDPVTTAWNQVQSVTDTVFAAVKNVLIAVWDAIYSSVIKPKVDAIESYLSEKWEAIRGAIETKIGAARDLIGAAWDAVSSKTTEVLNTLLGFVRDTIFEPIRAAVETKINAARDLFGQALDAVKTKAEGVLNPLLTWWRDTIWGPMGEKATSVMDGADGVRAKFVSAIETINTTVNGTLQSLKGVWETTWTAIQKAAESPQQAMNVLIELVNKLKSIVPEWLIPHSPTPFQIGLEGIMKAARQMDGAFGDMSGVEGWIKAAMNITGVGGDWLSGLMWLAQHESTGNPRAVNPEAVSNGEHASGLFQTIPSTFKHYRDRDLPDDIFNPIANAVAAIRYIMATYGDIDTVISGWSRRGGYAEGGWAGLHGPELAWLGEKGPEYVIPNHALGGMAGGREDSIRIDVAVGGKVAEQIWISGYQLLARRGGLPAQFGAIS